MNTLTNYGEVESFSDLFEQYVVENGDAVADDSLWGDE